MAMTHTGVRDPLPPLTPRRGLTITPAGNALWRVLRDGRVRGHLHIDIENAQRVRALRFHPPRGCFVTIGEFWNADDAVSALLAA